MSVDVCDDNDDGGDGVGMFVSLSETTRSSGGG